MKRFLIGLLLAASTGFSEDTAGVEFFESKVRPVLAKNCYVCHSTEAPAVQGALRVDTAKGLRSGGNAGPLYVPGKPERSLLVRALSHRGALKMPPGGKLEEAETEAISEWIRMGAPLPEPEASAKSQEEGPKHWAFQPLLAADPPRSENSWVRSPIDAFILSRLEEERLGPSPEADRRTLLRRAHLDLTGLPPTAEEIESDELYEEIVDRLLASRRFGERWARHWLDVARYADEGFQARAFAISWTYRDWVIDALNEDMPYDRFVQRQLAADLLNENDKRHLAALVLLTVGINLPRPTDVPENLDDRIDVVTRGFLGMSVACARCHDHKFDPIPQKDYYALYSVFLNSPDVLEPVPIDTLPETPLGRFYAEKLKARREWIDRFTQERLEFHKAEFRRAEALERYLSAAWTGRDASDSEMEALSKEKNLNLYILQRWRNLLVESIDAGDGRFEPFVEAQGSEPAVRAFARQLAAADRQEPWGESGRERLRLLLHAEGAPTNVPFEDFWWVQNEGDSNTLKALGWAYKEVMTDWSYRGGPRHAMTVNDAKTREQAVVFVRGNQHDRGAEVGPRFLTALGANPFKEGSGRLELARAIGNHPLTARVMVNRVWQHLFGFGIVRSPSNFGLRGDAPTHPELLEYLAAKFIESGWSVKALIREIMLSSAYRQASAHVEDCAASDPENRLLWRQNRRRLEFEALRDSMLSVAGRLDPSVGGGPFDLRARPASRRRSIYAYISREEPSGTMRNFDFSNPEQHTPQRERTTVPQQALFLMNSRFVGEQARALAARLDPDGTAERAKELYRLALGRDPSPRELALATTFVQPSEETDQVATEEPVAWRYGSGRLDPDQAVVTDFRPFTVWVDDKWQHASMLPAREGGRAGRATLSASGGSPGDDLSSAVVRRWVSPLAGKIKISGGLKHNMGEAAWRFDYSNGVRGWIVSDRKGVLAQWIVQGVQVATEIDGLQVEQGEQIDFVVDARDDYLQDNFTWAPNIEQVLGAEEKEAGVKAEIWNASEDFRGPSDRPLTGWERLAQVLLLTNEFSFVD